MAPLLRFRPDGTFTIVQLTDLHWRDGRGVDVLTRSLMELVLDAEQPDLVVLTGDVLEASECLEPAESWRQVVQPIDSRQVPWASVFGNHDDEGIVTREELMVVEQSYGWSLSEPGPAELPGVGNYLRFIWRADADVPAVVLYFLDSGGYVSDESGCGYAGVSREQVAWFRTVSRDVATATGPLATAESARTPATGPVGLAFFHVPLHEYKDAFATETALGMMREPICCARENTGLFAALCDASHVVGAFAGHDHANDFDATLCGIRLCYGRVSGYGGYGCEDVVPGARVIRLRQGERKFATWLRLADGSEVIHEDHRSKLV